LIGSGFVGCGEEILFGDGEVGFGLEGALGVEICDYRERQGGERERFRQ
jgi:hypothetical protein